MDPSLVGKRRPKSCKETSLSKIGSVLGFEHPSAHFAGTITSSTYEGNSVYPKVLTVVPHLSCYTTLSDPLRVSRTRKTPRPRNESMAAYDIPNSIQYAATVSDTLRIASRL